MGTLTLVSIKDRGATAATTDDTTYLGVALSDFDGNLVGLDDVLVFHAYDVDALLNKAADSTPVTPPAKLDWSTFANTGLDLSAALAGLNGTGLGDLTASVDLAVDGGVALNVLDGVLVAKGDFTIALGQVKSADLPNPTQDADAMTLTLSNVGVFAGVGGSFDDNGTPTDYSDDAVVNGTLGFGATVTKLTLVSIKDRGATAATTDDTTYLGVALSDFDGNLVGLDDVLVFHAYDVDALLNKAADSTPLTPPAKLDWSTFANTGLDLSAALAGLNGTGLGDLTASVDLAVDGGVALNVLDGVLVAKGDFTIALGQVKSADLPNPTQDADAMTLTLSNVGVFAGVGGSFDDNGTPTDYSDDAVVNGTLGFGATVTKLTLVSIKDRGATAATTDDTTYLGVALSDFDGNLVGLDDVLVFHAYDVDALLNKAADSTPLTPPAKLDWSTFANTGLDLSAALAGLNGTGLGDLTASVDLAVDGGVALNVLDGVLVAKGDFTIALGQVKSADLPNPTQDADAMTLTLSNVGVFVGVGGSFDDNGTPTDYSDDAVVNGTLGFGATVTKLTLVSIKDRGATAATTDDTTYLGVALSDFDGNLVGLDDVLAFHAYDVDALLNKAADSTPLTPPAKLDWSTFSHTGLDLSAALAALNGTSLGDLTASVDLAVDGGVALIVLDGVLVAKGDFTIALGQVKSADLPNPTQDADAMTLTLSNVGVFVGVGGSFDDNGTATDYSDDAVVNGTLGFGATVTKLTLVSIKDRGANAALATDDTTYLGVALADFDGNLVGLDDVLVFHAYDVDALLNKAADGTPLTPAAKLDWSTFSNTGLDLSAALAALNGTGLGDLTASVDLAVDGGVALNVLDGVLVAKGDFTIALGQVRSADLPSGATQDADAMTLTLSNVGVFVGVGGSFDAKGTPTDYSDDVVVDGTLGFGATVSQLTLVSIKDRGANAALTTDDTTYLGVALADFDGNLVGLDDVLVFHAYDVDALLNKAADSTPLTPAAKLDWST